MSNVHDDIFKWQIGEFCSFIVHINYYFDAGQNLYCNAIDAYFEGSGEMYEDFNGDELNAIYDGALIVGFITCNQCLYFLYVKGGVMSFPCSTIANGFYTKGTGCIANYNKEEFTFYANYLTELKRGFGVLAENYVMVQCTQVFTDVQRESSFFNANRNTIKSITIGNYADIGKYAFYRLPYTTIECGPLNNVGEYAFSNCNKLNDNIEIIGEIGQHAFEYCYYLTSVKCNGNIIGYNAFQDCEKLENVILNSSKIRAQAFLGCYSLKSIDLKNVEEIGNWAFGKCSALQYIYNFKYFEDNNSTHYTNGIFWLDDSFKDNPLQTYVSGDNDAILEYKWIYDYRILNIITGYTLNIENHNNEWITIPLSYDSSGQLKFYCDESLMTCHLTDDLDTKYTGVCVAADGKWYQFKE